MSVWLRPLVAGLVILDPKRLGNWNDILFFLTLHRKNIIKQVKI